MSEQTSLKVEPRIVNRNAFNVAGLRYAGKNQHGEIPALWEVFLPRMSELQNASQPDYECYGICRTLPAGSQEEGFEYLACVEVPSFDALPQGITGWEVPASTFAVLPCNDVAGIAPTCDYFYAQWLPNSQAYAPADGPMFEEYPPEYPTDPTIYLYFPVQQK
jgi:predicted transcriptional regulator YdeE